MTIEPGRISRPLPVSSGGERWLPGLQVVGGYQRGWFSKDLLAGLVVTTMLVPIGVAYAEASGVPAISHPGSTGSRHRRARDGRGRDLGGHAH